MSFSFEYRMGNDGNDGVASKHLIPLKNPSFCTVY